MKGRNNLKGKTALVTGATRRLGKAISIALAQNQINVVVHYNRSEIRAKKLVEKIKDMGVGAWFVKADLGEIKNCSGLFSDMQKKIPKIDFLVNNASIFPRSGFHDFSEEEFHEVININALSPFELSRNFVEQTQKGVIINLLDTRIKAYDLSCVSYQLSKNLLWHMTRMMAIAYAPKVRVNAIAPGLILPPLGKDKAYLEKMIHTNLLKKEGSLTDITEALLFLLTNQFITGETIFVDGGQNLRGSIYEGKTDIR